MNEQQGQDVKLSAEEIRGAAIAGLNLLERDTTLTPGSMRNQINVLAMVLNGVASGNLVVVSPNQLTVNSGDAPKLDKDAVAEALAALPEDIDPDGDTNTTEAQAGGDAPEPQLQETNAGIQPANSAG